jgi:hypothetical protein
VGHPALQVAAEVPFGGAREMLGTMLVLIFAFGGQLVQDELL